jgi:hypothetical protein
VLGIPQLTTRKKPGVAFWLTIGLIGLPFLYVLSFGPACWLVGQDFIPSSVAYIFYKPVLKNLSPSLTRYATMNNLESMIGLLRMQLEPNSKEVSRTTFR